MDLSAIAIVDNHAHPLTRRQPASPEEFRRHFSESPDAAMAGTSTATAAHYRWALRQLGRQLDVAPDEKAILRARESSDFETYARELTTAAGIDWLLLDTGFPPPDESWPPEEMTRTLRLRVAPILRIETLVQELIRHCDRWENCLSRFDEKVSAAAAAGYVALKSIACYRSGLAIEQVKALDAARAFEREIVIAQAATVYRLTAKLLIDFFVWRAAGHAATSGLPFQFHTGYGDPDLDLRLANPLHLRPLFESSELGDVPIVLLHGSYPFTAEASYLAAVYPNAYLDLPFSLPPLDLFELRRIVHIALGAAPADKLMCSSDGTCIPEHYWLGAVRARRVVGDVLEEMVGADLLDKREAWVIAQGLLRENAIRIYGLDGRPRAGGE